MSRQYDFTLAAPIGSNRTVQAAGSVCRMVNTPGGPVRVRTDNGDTYELEAGQGFRMPAGVMFREIQISNINGIGQTGSVFIGGSNFEDTRIPGSVKVVDGAAATVAADVEYIASNNCGGVPAAARYANLQIWNGSTTQGVVIRTLVCQFSTLAMSLRMRLANVDLAVAPVQLGSKRARSTGGGVGSGSSIGLRSMNTGLSGAGNDMVGLIGGMNFPMYVPAGAEQTEIFGLRDAPILLGPGTGLYVAAEAAQSDFQILVGCQIVPWVWG